MKKIAVKISGMGCNACIQSVENALKELDGVESVKVSLEAASAEIHFDESRVDQHRMEEAVDAAGYLMGGSIL